MYWGSDRGFKVKAGAVSFRSLKWHYFLGCLNSIHTCAISFCPPKSQWFCPTSSRLSNCQFSNIFRVNHNCFRYNFEVGTGEENRFPFKLHSVHPTFIAVQMNKPFQLSVNLHSDHEIPLNNCTLKAVFKPLNPKNIYFNAPSFECISQVNTKKCTYL